MRNDIFASIFSVQLVLGLLQSITLSIATRCNRRANLTMAAFIVTCSLLSLDCYLQFTGRMIYAPYLVRALTPLYTLIGILPFLYTKCLTDKSFRYDLKTIIYFIPFIISVLAYTPVYFYSAEQKINYFLNIEDMNYRLVIYIFICISNISYTLNSYLRIKKYHKAVKNYYSNLSALQFKWIENLFLLLTSIVCINFLFSLVSIGDNFKYTYVLLMLSFFILSVFMGFSAMAKVDPLFHLIDDFKLEINEDRKKKSIPDPTYYKLTELIDNLLRDKIYLDPDLKMSTLAKKTGHPSYLVSLFINKHYDMTFFELINLHRIEEAKRRLLDEQYQHLTILAISQDIGFSSKSAFNSTFKKVTGVTPSIYKSTNS